MAEASKPTKSSKPHDLIHRGIKRHDVPGTLTFIGLRAIEPLLQYGILAHGVGSSLVHGLGLKTLPAGPPNTGTPLDVLGLSPYRLILLGMAVGSAVKHTYWVTVINQEEFGPGLAAFVAIFNSVGNCINSLLFTCTLTSASLSSGSRFPQTPLLVGAGLYTAGILLEVVSETQRKAFKDDPKNKGKVCTTGLWSLSRHMNYAGYALWRTGYALAAGGWIWGAFNFAIATFDFTTRGIPALEAYCSDRVSSTCLGNSKC
jgi:protein-S-isoprenylcysteine O-methyltransferase Ste14